MALRALKKITFRDVVGKPEKIKHKIQVPTADGMSTEEKEVWLARPGDLMAVIGKAHNHRSGNTPLGDYMEFVGTFEAYRLSDGEVFQSTRCIFPPIAGDMAEEAYLSAKRNDDSAIVEFGFVVGVEPDHRSAEGYRFTCKPLRAEADRSADPLAELKSSLAASFAQALGAEVTAKLGLPAPGDQAAQIEHKPTKRKAEAEAA